MKPTEKQIPESLSSSEDLVIRNENNSVVPSSLGKPFFGGQ